MSERKGRMLGELFEIVAHGSAEGARSSGGNTLEGRTISQNLEDVQNVEECRRCGSRLHFLGRYLCRFGEGET